MTAMRVGVIDYGVGNLRSVANAVLEIGAEPCISSDAAELSGCQRLILPGVGAFGEGMRALRATGLDHLVRDAAGSGTPLLGICLGMQMLVESSTEFGEWDGLAILPGQVEKLEDPQAQGTQRLPNVGWLPLSRPAGSNSLDELFAGIEEDARFYFIHSFAVAGNSASAVATAHYGSREFAAVIARENVIGTQFHPEKSGPAGLRLLRNFLS
jgi:glutamine amidotransferase